MPEEQVDQSVRGEHDAHDADDAAWAAGEDRTGVPEVDAVLADVSDGVRGPVADHVAVFERAHERLRRALDSRPDA